MTYTWKDVIKDIQAWLVVLFVLAILVMLIIGMFKPQADTNINLNVTGVTGSLNASTLTSLHYQCIEMCIHHGFDYSSELDKCYQQCASLGKEECGNGEIQKT